MLTALACTVFGALVLWTWWCEMFSDNIVGQMGRAMEDHFGLGKNLSAVTYPAGAASFFLAGIGMIIDAASGPETLKKIFVFAALFLLAIAVLGVIPFPLPDWMYPAKREAKRRQKAQNDIQKHFAGIQQQSSFNAPQLRNTHMGEKISISTPDDWTTITADQLPEGALGTAADDVRLIVTKPPKTVRFAPNIVVLRTPIDKDVDPEAVLADSRDALVRNIPGLLLIEDAPWPPHNRSWSGVFRTGIYILNEDSLTLIQWAWVHTDEDGPALWTATFSCLSADYPNLSQTALEMVATMEVER
ncbi:hypothetical protein [Schaalia vaccimaxillae]|uniref:hypothetical protein n=1 Tax=Schaalia vaccimaxillae TaxID=183916 RepID=UPI0003B66FF5|nr:hypothetical protein [Schaalia vaccimaxillae]